MKMRKISDEEFVTDECREYALDDVLAIRIRYGDFYFLGWMENAERYSIQWAKSNFSIRRDILHICDDIYDVITRCKGYNYLENDWLKDENGNLLNKEDYKYQNASEKFLTLLSNINSYHRNGEIGHIGHSIFLMTQKEFSDCIDELKDGDYVFVIK
jgi:hypothetical protein